MNKKAKAAIIIAAVLLVGGGAVAGLANMANSIAAVESESMGKQVDKVETRDVTNYVGVSGNVAGINSVKIAAPANSKVLELDTDLGSEVKKGELLCVFDTEDLENDLASLKKKVNLSDDKTDDTHKLNERSLQQSVDDQQRQIADAQEVVNKAIKERDKAYKKYNDEVKKYNDQVKDRDKAYDELQKAKKYDDYEEKKAKYNEIEEKVKAYKTQLDTMKEALEPYDEAIKTAQKQYDAVVRSTDQAIQSVKDTIHAEKYSDDDTLSKQLSDLEKQIADCEVTAPIDGVISELGITEGGIPETKSILTIENTEALKIKVSIKERDILKIHEGMKAEITVDAIPDKIFEGEVTRVVNVPMTSYSSDGSDGSAGTTTYSAEVTINEKDTGLLIGMNAKVKIILSEKKNCMSVPFDSLKEDEDGSKVVFVAEDLGDGTVKARAVSVTVDLESDYYVAVTSNELKDGDSVILEPDDIADGDVVKVMKNDYNFFDGGEG